MMTSITQRVILSKSLLFAPTPSPLVPVKANQHPGASLKDPSPIVRDANSSNVGTKERARVNSDALLTLFVCLILTLSIRVRRAAVKRNRRRRRERVRRTLLKENHQSARLFENPPKIYAHNSPPHIQRAYSRTTEEGYCARGQQHLGHKIER